MSFFELKSWLQQFWTCWQRGRVASCRHSKRGDRPARSTHLRSLLLRKSSGEMVVQHTVAAILCSCYARYEEMPDGSMCEIMTRHL